MVVTVYYEDDRLGRITTTHNLSLETCLALLDFDIPEYERLNDFEVDYDLFRLEFN